MMCLVCKSATAPFFEKRYFESAVNINLDVSYRKCENCGFVCSETHQNMSESEWEELNHKFHHGIEQKHENRLFNQPPYIDIGLALHVLHCNGLVNLESTLDYAAGYGTLASVLKKYFLHEISTYDEFVNNGVDGSDKEILELKYATVINTAMFEHVINRKSLDRVSELVNENGAFVIHTYVSETIPCDPNWSYLEPIVHCAFFTNHSMRLLTEQWGYVCSIYIPTAKIWVLFKNAASVREKVDEINRNLQNEYIVYKDCFCDYWK